MKALNELYIYLICCWIFATLFAAYLAIKLRAYRIANAKLKSRLDLTEKDLKDAFDSYDTIKHEFDSFKYNAASILNTSTENNAKLTKELQSLKEVLDMLMDKFEQAKRDKKILHSMAKGATDKLAEMNALMEEFIGRESVIDWTKLQTFPEGYEIPNRTNVIAIENLPNVDQKREGKMGTTIGDGVNPLVSWGDNIIHFYHGTKLAPVNPEQHPLNPLFRP